MASRLRPCQPGVLSEGTRVALFLILQTTEPNAEKATVNVVATVPERVRRLARLAPRGRLDATIGVGARFWDRLRQPDRPTVLREFPEIQGPQLSAPSTGGDVFLHIKSDRPDLNFELAQSVLHDLHGRVRVLEEVHGFTYLDSRDLTGFIDGTANPKGRERAHVALIGEEDPVFAGGSYVVTQRYVHDLEKWSGLPVREQEAAIGRTKRDSRELKSSPAVAHIRRAEISDDSGELKIVRQSLPYGTLSGDRGLFFVAYAKDPRRFEHMLSRLLGTADDGLHDRLMEFTRAVSGAYFFAPTLKLLRSLGR
jgi:putative iron-dependent peroxidase